MKRLKITTLDKGWHDKDEVLLHAAFQLLADFVEKEQPDKLVDWDADELHRSAWEEITGLYTSGGRRPAPSDAARWTTRNSSGRPSSSRKSPDRTCDDG